MHENSLNIMQPVAPFAIFNDPTIKVIKNVLSAEQLANIRNIADECTAKTKAVATIGFGANTRLEPEKRYCTVGWFQLHDPKTDGIYQMLGEAVQEANGRSWQYDITGFYDRLQCCVYRAGEGGMVDGHFTWHRDSGDDWNRPQRKLSVVMILSSPDEYEGGDFQIFDGSPQTITLKEPGTIYVFPSYLQHRVTPVTKGERRSIVGWLCGPKFR